MAFDRRLGFAALIPILVAALLSLPISSPRSAIDDYEWLEDGARMHILATVVRPRGSACEQYYPFFDFPFCPPGEPINRTKSFKDLLNGDCFINTQYEVRFKTREYQKTLCEKTLTKEEVAKFKHAIRRDFVLGLTHGKGIFLWSEVGIIADDGNGPRYYLVTHLNFYIEYYKNRVISVKLISGNEDHVEITKDAETRVNFTYSVFWRKVMSNDPRLSEEDEMFNDHDEGSCNLALLSVSTITVLICVIMLLIVTLPYLMSYFIRCSYSLPRREEEHSDMHIRYDDYPRNTSLLGAILGNGIQLLIMVCILFFFAYKGYLYPCNLRLLAYRIMQSYFLASVSAGYKAVSFHGRFSQVGWKECIFQAATIYFVPVLVTTLVTNCLALYKHGKASELDVIFAIVPYLEFAAIVYIIQGGVVAHSLRSGSQPPRATTRVHQENPFQPWYMRTPIQMLLGALIPSVALFREMDEIYASLWNLKLCGAFQTLLFSFTWLIFLTVLTAICFTMAKYDHKWCWRSVLRGGSPAIFMFFYGIYFFSRTRINERLMIRIVGYNACISYGLFLILGTISFYASSLVVHVKHEVLKMD